MSFPRRFTGCALGVAVIALAGCCAANSTQQLQRVAKDWSLTIRASQIIPVYPLSEDVQPGDVFLVPTPISEQASVYEEKGFLPTDLLEVRLEGLDYSHFYEGAYWSGDYAHVPHPRPASSANSACASWVDAPRAAFPSYTFSVARSAGLQLAVPIQGIPVGLGLMGASNATGTVTIDDSYTYGIDGESAYKDLVDWYEKTPGVKDTLRNMVNSSDKEIYLRVVTRVYLTCKLDVSLAKTGSVSGGVDIGAAPTIKLPSLAASNPASAAAAASAYKVALKALSAPLKGATPGVATRFTQVSGHSVSLSQTFNRPLVIGFVGFDVKVFENGALSPPIPSFAVVNGAANKKAFSSFCKSADQKLNHDYAAWLGKTTDGKKNFNLMQEWLRAQGEPKLNPSNLGWICLYQPLLRKAQEHFKF